MVMAIVRCVVCANRGDGSDKKEKCNFHDRTFMSYQLSAISYQLFRRYPE